MQHEACLQGMIVPDPPGSRSSQGIKPSDLFRVQGFLVDWLSSEERGVVLKAASNMFKANSRCFSD